MLLSLLTWKMDTAIDIDWLLSPFFFSEAPEKGRGKKIQFGSLYQAPCMFQEMRWRSYNMSVTWCKREDKPWEELLSDPWTHTHTKVCSYSNVMHYKEPLGIIRSIIPPFFFLPSICAALIQSMSECLWRIGQEKSGASCGLASNQKDKKRSSLFHRKIFF